MNIISKGKNFIQRIGVDKLFIVLLTGILLVIISIPTKPSKKSNEQTVTKYDTTDYAGYERYLEEKLEKNLGKIKNLGEVSVIVKVKNDGELVVKSNVSRNEKNVDETDSSGGVRKSREITNNEEVVMEERDSGTYPYVTSKIYPSVEGVVIIAKGGGDAKVKAEVIEAVEALLSVPSHKIKVLEMK